MSKPKALDDDVMPGAEHPPHVIVAEEWRVRGIVQGVGFRPTVYRMAMERGLRGAVWNDAEGVCIRIAGNALALDDLFEDLTRHPPPLARIDAIERSRTEPVDDVAFVILSSGHGRMRTAISPDAATCAACLAEMIDPGDRRHGYAFTNCTHCGPRLSIVHAAPYDRANTSMRVFPMCAACGHEYRDPGDRRFHAQPNACPACGPRLMLEPITAEQTTTDPLLAAARLIASGAIVAIKGLGGIHLACDASNADAVAELRQRKRRHGKPLALMARDPAQLRRYCHVDAEEEALLLSPAAPIVLLHAHVDAGLAPVLSPGLDRHGCMLPYTPLHHRLLAALPGPIVLTSGNQSDEPQCIDNDDARQRLAGIADAFLLHDREIVNRLDDSVARIDGGTVRLIRRARGYAPAPLPMPDGFADAPPLVALGGELKSTFCLLRDGAAVLSPHLGDLEHAAAYAAYKDTLRLFLALYELRPSALAIDAHPEYLSSKFGRDWSERDAIPIIEAQHHHAHIAACMAENGVPLDAPPVLGVALDGLGYGDDGGLWGGEFLHADYRDSRRLASFAPVPMPGGMQAIREPWRMAYACMRQPQSFPAFPAHLAVFKNRPTETLERMLQQRINSPLTSSCGRLFDAAAALAGLRATVSYEGQAACELEAVVDAQALLRGEAYPFEAGQGEAGGLALLQHAAVWRALVADVAQGISIGRIAARFHNGLIEAIVTMVEQLTLQHGDPWQGRVALSGGVFQNAIVSRELPARLRARGFIVLEHAQVPPNDGGLAFGQAAIGAARLLAAG